MLEDWEKTGPRILKSRAGMAARRMIAFLSHSTSSDTPKRSNRIQSLAPPAFFFPFTPPPTSPATTALRLLLFVLVLLTLTLLEGGGERIGYGGEGKWEGGVPMSFLGRRRTLLLLRLKEKGPLPIFPMVPLSL
ncbi:hypothetical protein EV1_044132 [Malus domestica]